MSVSSLASSNVSTGPSAQSAPRQLSLGRDSLERNLATCPSPLPSISTFDHRASLLSQGSKTGFSRRQSSVNYKSPLSDYRTSYHPPPSFVHHSSSSSMSQSSESVESIIWSKKPSEDKAMHHWPSSSSKGLNGEQPGNQMDGMEPARPVVIHESQIRSVYSQGIPSHHRTKDSFLSSPSKLQPYDIPQETASKKRKGSESDDTPRLGSDPLSVLVYAGDIIDRNSRKS